jgi:DNA-binding transcriptional regulator/RsmH inhibitor MraZ
VETQVDERGRIRIPAEFAHFLHRLDSRFFLTTLDGEILRIYSQSNWKLRVAALQNSPAEHRAAAADVLFLANHYGGAGTMDGQFRMVLPERLRDKLDLKSSKIWLESFGDHYNGYTDGAYRWRLERAEEGVAAKVARLAESGLV